MKRPAHILPLCGVCTSRMIRLIDNTHACPVCDEREHAPDRRTRPHPKRKGTSA